MHKNEELIQKFYHAFQARDAETMGSLYHEDVKFSDPMFPDLKGRQVYGMWAMLIERLSPEGKIACLSATADEGSGKASWEAIYEFSQTKRLIHNKIQAEFRFQDGKIIEHKDRFSFWKWAWMAQGWKGLLFGWLPSVQKKAQAEIAKTLGMYMKRRRIS
jgi:ketosteroid isomerase-like protein